MLFQPTNIIPDLRGSLGDGVVDATDDFIVTWQINGTSGMNQYYITIYDTSNTQLYQSATITETETVYGTNARGEKQLFYHNFGDLSSYISNGNEYRLKITMINTALSQTVVQNSASAFITRAEPSLQISSTKSSYTQFPATISTRSCTIYGIYSQAQGDAINWIRWKLAYAGDLTNTIYDSQNIYGTGELEMEYDGFITGTSYSVKCIVETTSGIQVDTGWTTFYVSYSTSEITSNVEAKRLSGDTTAVQVTWGENNVIPGVASGGYSIVNETLYLTTINSNVYWDTQNGRALNIPTDWNFITRIVADDSDANLFQITMAGPHTISAVYTYSARTLELKYDDTVLHTITGVYSGITLTLMLSPTKFYVRYTQGSGGLYPSNTLYPAENLYPQTDTGITLYKTATAITYTQGNINKILLSGKLKNEFSQVIVGDITEITTTISSTEYTIEDAVYEYGYYTTPNANVEGSYFLVNYDDGLNAGSRYVISSEILGWAVYRKSATETVQKHIADIALESMVMYDYGVPNNFGSYTYYVYPIGSTTYITSPMVSNSIAPCYWNYSILECSYDEDHDCYVVLDEFAFGNNVSTGNISNNNEPTINSNFTRYPTVQMSCQNYMSGTLNSLIGGISVSNGDIVYADTKTLRDRIFDLSTTTNTLFLKTRKGDVLLIKIAGAITMETSDNTREQMLSASIPWVEIGSSDGCNLIQGLLYEI